MSNRRTTINERLAESERRERGAAEEATFWRGQAKAHARRADCAERAVRAAARAVRRAARGVA